MIGYGEGMSPAENQKEERRDEGKNPGFLPATLKSSLASSYSHNSNASADHDAPGCPVDAANQGWRPEQLSARR